MNQEMKQDSLVIKFEGNAVADHSVQISSFIQTLTGLEKLSHKTIENCYGKKTKSDVKIHAMQPGSFIFELLLTYAEPVRVLAENTITFNEAIFSVIELVKFLKGNKPLKQEPCTDNMFNTTITNCEGNTQVFNNCTVKLYNDGSVRSALNKTTAPLDLAGFDNISIKTSDKSSSVSKSERTFFSDNQNEVLNENEATIILEVTELNLSGTNKKWRFYDGELEFFANIEDDDFLEAVKNKEYSFTNGTQLKVVLRTIQKKGLRITTERTITDVIQVINDVF